MVDPIAEITQFRGNLLVVVGTKDVVVAPQPEYGQKYLKYHGGATGSKSRLLVLDADHLLNILTDHQQPFEEALKESLSFLRNTL